MVKEKVIDGKTFVSVDGGVTWHLKEADPDPDGGEGGEKKPDNGEEADKKPEGDDANVDKEAEKLGQAIAEKAGQLAAQLAEKQAKAKGAQPNADISVREPKLKLYTTRKGKAVEISRTPAMYIGNWLKSVLRKDRKGMEEWDQKLAEVTKLEPLNETTAAEGGNLVPTLLYNVLIDIIQDKSVMAQIANTIDMTGMKTNTLNVDAVASRPIASWGSENTDKGTSSMTFGQQSLTPYLLACIIPVTKQLLEDSAFNVTQILTTKLAESIAVEEDKAFFAGSGTGRPTGLNTYTFRGQNFGDVNPTYDLVNSAYWRLPQAYRSRAVWVGNGQLLEALSNIKDNNNMPIFKELITEPGIMGLKGRPVYEQNDLEATSLWFGDFYYYWIARKGGVAIDLSEEATLIGNGTTISLWQRNLVALRAETRVDGECVLTRGFVEISNINIG